MAVIRDPTDANNSFNYISTLGLLGCMGTIILMLKFKGFRASLDFTTRRKHEDNGVPVTLSMTGAYRVNRDEFYGNGRIFEPPKRLSPSMVKLPPSSQPESTLRPTTSVVNLTRPELPRQLDRGTLNVSLDPRGASTSNRRSSINEDQQPKEESKKTEAKNKEQQKLEKKKLAEQKAREKAEAQERTRQEKARKEREKKAAREEAKAKKESKKKKTPAQQLPSNPLAMNQGTSYATNTLDSSISKSSGPPPYSEVPEVRLGEVEDRNSSASTSDAVNSNPGNVSFGKPIENTPNSWDMISQHRQQMNRPVSTSLQKERKKNMVMDLQYRMGNSDNNDNSEA